MLQGEGKGVLSRDNSLGEVLETRYRWHRGRCPGLPCFLIHRTFQAFFMSYRKITGSVNVQLSLLKMGIWAWGGLERLPTKASWPEFDPQNPCEQGKRELTHATPSSYTQNNKLFSFKFMHLQFKFESQFLCDWQCDLGGNLFPWASISSSI